MAYDELVLPDMYEDWETFAGSVFDEVYVCCKERPFRKDEKIEDVLSGRAGHGREKDRQQTAFDA